MYLWEFGPFCITRECLLLTSRGCVCVLFVGGGGCVDVVLLCTHSVCAVRNRYGVAAVF